MSKGLKISLLLVMQTTLSLVYGHNPGNVTYDSHFVTGKMSGDTLYSGSSSSESEEVFIISFTPGKSNNHPSFVFWIEDLEGNYIETLYVTGYVGSGLYRYADAGDGRWKNESGESVRPASLPYWAHKRGIISRDSLYIPVPENPVPDAYTGATPTGNFILVAGAGEKLPDTFRILCEINQPWDWNEYWTNDKYSGDKDYISSCQPSLIYAATIDKNKENTEYSLHPVGHGHYSGDNGRLYTDLSTMTTALHIADKMVVKVLFKQNMQ